MAAIRRISLVMCALVVTLGATTATEIPAQAVRPTAKVDHDADFDGDGWADLAATDYKRVNDSYRNELHVLYGGPGGISPKRTQTWTSASFRPADTDRGEWARALATGDFNADGFSDLAIGGGIPTSQVRILYGSRKGLSIKGTQRWESEIAGRSPELRGDFGTTLVAGNFGHGKQDDLAISVPSAAQNAGAVLVLYGSTAGLSRARRQLWSLSVPGMLTSADKNVPNGTFAQFGRSLTPGRFTGGTYHDLAIGAPGETVGRTVVAGAVHILRGSASGLTVTRNQVWTQDSVGIGDAAEPGDSFGTVLAAADFQADGRDDLAIGIPGERIGTKFAAGAVQLIYASPTGLAATGSQFWTQNSPGVQGVSETFDNFGGSLAVGQFGRDRSGRRFADLAIGVPREGVGFIREAGATQVFYGSSTGLTSKNDQFWSRNSRGVKGKAMAFVGFGRALAVGNLGHGKRRGYSDLAIATPNEVTPQGRTGSVTVLYATAGGLRAARDEFWYPKRIGVRGDRSWFGGLLVN